MGQDVDLLVIMSQFGSPKNNIYFFKPNMGTSQNIKSIPAILLNINKLKILLPFCTHFLNVTQRYPFLIKEK